MCDLIFSTALTNKFLILRGIQNDNNNKLQLGCHSVAVVILHVYKT